MNYCKTCGSSLPDDALFCRHCGSKIQVTPPNPPVAPSSPEQAPLAHHNTISQQQIPSAESFTPSIESIQEFSTPPKRKKGKIVLFLILSLLVTCLIGAGVLFLRWYTSTEQRIIRALDSGKYSDAIALAKDARDVRDSDNMIDHAISRTERIKTDFHNGTIDYAAAKKELDTLKELKIEDTLDAVTDAESYINTINESRASFSTAESFYSTGDYAEAIRCYKEVSSEDTNYDTAVSKLADSENKYREEVLKKASDFANSKLYDNAITLLENALTVIPGDTKIKEQIRLYEKSDYDAKTLEALSSAETMANNNDYAGALKTLSEFKNGLDANTEVISAYNKYSTQYEKQVIGELDALVAAKNFDGAIAAVNTALSILPESEALKSKLEELNAKKPISITTLTPVNEDDWGAWNEGSPVDPFGNDYSTACNYVIFHGYELGIRVNEEHYEEYRLYKKYGLLTGSIVNHIDCPENRINRLQIYTDDTLVYTSVDLTRKTDSISFAVDVTGIEYVKIVVYTDSGAYCILSNVQLWPK